MPYRSGDHLRAALGARPAVLPNPALEGNAGPLRFPAPRPLCARVPPELQR